MKKPLLTALVLGMALSSCGNFSQSRLNPMNWFGRAEPVAQQPLVTEAQDPRLLVQQVVSLSIDPMLGGAIIRATGLPPTQGFWEAELIEAETTEAGVKLYEFRVFPPIEATRSSTPRSREITVAVSLTNQELQDISRITVQGEMNALSSRR